MDGERSFPAFLSVEIGCSVLYTAAMSMFLLMLMPSACWLSLISAFFYMFSSAHFFFFLL